RDWSSDVCSSDLDFAAGKPLDREAVLAWLGSEQGIRATPHSQRSVAEVKVRLLPSFQDFPIVALIDRVEQALRTPVQTAVKRADEQAFALLNGQNLMFCEDAARRIQAALEQDERSQVLSRCGWSPFEGRRFRSRVAATWVNGQLAWDGRQLVGAPNGQRLAFAR